jgi:hypothetical protein
MKTLILLYNLLIVTIVCLAGILMARDTGNYYLPLLFVPVAIYFARQLYQASMNSPLFNQPAPHPRPHPKPGSNQLSQSRVLGDGQQIIDPEILSDEDVADINKRLFLKLVGSAGLSLFFFSLFSKRTHAAFFGSMPGPGIISIKDSSGNVIDPAEKQPTDGYEISDVDDTTLPAYYGFIDKDGNWYIAREGTDGSFRYTTGSTGYSTNWDTRTTLGYSNFSTAF